MSQIRNTTADMGDPDHPDRLLVLASGLATGDGTEFVEGQERAGQRQLLASSFLPADTGGRDAEFEAVGFVFGEIDPNDRLFRHTQLPAGWSKQAGEHSMGSSILDELGRRRVIVFYKAAFYDRKANMTLVGVHAYLYACFYHRTEPITDETWATSAAIVKAAKHAITEAGDTIDLYRRTLERGPGDTHSISRIREYEAERDWYAALEQRHAPGLESGS